MTNEEAIMILKAMIDEMILVFDRDRKKALNMAIEALKAQLSNTSEIPNSSDLISRQAAIDALKNRWKKTRNYEGIGDDIAEECELYLKQVPSAQPEVIRCKDCKWYGRADKRRFYRGTDCLNHRIDTIVPDKDYCSRAERRTDE